MGIQTDLNRDPYWNDYDQEKDFYQILFQPGVSVQVRELNQLQTLLQKQVERFGDNIFKRGTIVDGCNFIFHSEYNYVKILDNEVSGIVASPALYNGQFVKSDSSGLKAVVNSVLDGFEASDPDLKSLYLTYLNGGDNGNTFAFTSGETLTVKDIQDSIYKVTIVNGGIGFSNNDVVVVTSALLVNVSTGTFSNGEYITNGTGANLQIVGIDSTTYLETDQIVLSLKPRDVDMANASANSLAWTISNNESIHNASNTVTGVVESVIGSGADFVVRTNGSGKITSVIVDSQGQNYTSIPAIRVRSSNNTTGLSVLDLTPQNYIGQITVASTANAVGNGYAFSITTGVIYQKGYFLRVSPQTVVVSNFSNAPDSLAVGFDTNEEIINADIDTSLHDPTTNDNFNAPGADRLKLVPVLKVLSVTEARANTDFFSLVEWSEGLPYKQNQLTSYNKINDEISRRDYERSGNYVVDTFLLGTRSPSNSNNEGKYVSVIVDPGIAYIEGNRVATNRNYSTDILKGIDSKITNTATVDLFYGNYVYISEVGGTFQFSTGDTVDLYDTAKTFLSNTAAVIAGNTTPVGTKIGTARIRSMVYDRNPIGIPQTIHKLYLFEIQMSQGKSFRNVKAVYYNGTSYKGIADIVQELDATTNNYNTILTSPNESSLVFYSGAESLKNANNVSYTYRTIDQTATIANTGLLVKDISASPNEFFPYSGSLSSGSLSELYVTPVANNLTAANNLTGTLTVNTTSNVATGSSTTFTTELAAGDYIMVGNSTSNTIKRVISVVNATSLQLDSNCAFANATANFRRSFPKNVPVPLGSRSGLSANVNSNGNILTINFGMNFDTTTSTNTALAVNIQRRGITQSTKTANRSRFVKIAVANNAGGTYGPWTIGVPDVFRLRSVYMGNSSVSTTDTNVVHGFYVDSNQTPNYLGLSYLYLKPKSNIISQINANTYFLVEVDYFTGSGSGFYDTPSYVSANAAQVYVNDSLPLANLGSAINTFEIPQLIGSDGKSIDLISHFDLRPYVSNTTLLTTNSAAAPINPAETVSFGNTADPANDKKFPLPGTDFTFTLEEYVGRTDSVVINKDGRISVISGKPDVTESKRYGANIPSSMMKISDLVIRPYPNLPVSRSNQIKQILNTQVANELFLKQREDDKTITTPVVNTASVITQPETFTMAEIGQLKRRVDDLEYYQRLSLLESDMVRRVIPSSIDPALNRFKFGFFVDDFNNYNNIDLNNPRHHAYIEDDDVVPEKMTWAINFPVSPGVPDYVDYLVVSQDNATVPVNAPEPACLPLTAVANTLSYRVQNFVGQVGNAVSSYVDSTTITMAANGSGSVELFFFSYNNYNKFEIYRGSTLVASSASAVPLTAADKTFVTGNDTDNWFVDRSSLYFSDVVIDGSGYAKYVGKIVINHNPASGRVYTIKAYKGNGSFEWRWLLRYPIDRSAVGCPIPVVTVSVPPVVIVIPDTPIFVLGDSGGDGDDGDSCQ